ncbi:MAG: hypothetical protein JWM64_2210 [Frankiales bacterium]|nr:hypothetical protein [Frankiales bacterium]
MRRSAVVRTRRAVAVALLGTVLVGAAASAATPSAAARKRVVVGADGYLFSSQDWTVPCQDAATSGEAAQRLVDLGRALQAGGRKPVLLLGPDKSTVMTADVPSTVPDKECHAAQHTAFWGKATSSPSFLDLRKPLQQAARTTQVYYRKDTHFAHGGDTVYARALLKRLDPLLALGQGSTTTTGTVRGDLATVLGLPAGEVVSARTNVNPGVTVRELPERKVGLVVPVKSFVATPTTSAGRVLPGRTVFVGDSFTAVAMYQLSQLSAETVFVWTDSSAPLQPMLDEIAQGDRVVIEVVERFATRYRMFRQDVVDGVAALPRREPTSSSTLVH